MDHDQIVGGERWFRWIGAAGIAVLLAGLALPLTDGDTAFYATVARGALKSGEWVAFYSPGGQVFDKPPLTIWLLGLSMAAFGCADWAVRLWHILFDLATLFVTSRLARITLAMRQTLAAPLVSQNPGQFFYQSPLPHQHLPHTLFVSGALGVGRFFHPVLSSPSATPVWTGMLAYVIFLPLGMLPWTGWLWPGLRDGWQARTGGPSVLRFCTVWLLTVLAFLTLSPGDKVIRYLLPAIPAAAVLIGHATDGDRWSKLASRVSMAMGGFLAAALVWLSRQSLPADAAAYLPVVQSFLLPLTIGLVGAAVLLFRGRRPQALVFISTLTLIAYGMLTAATVKQWDRISPWRYIAVAVNAITRPDARVVIEGDRTPFAEYYIERPVQFAGHEALVSALRAGALVAVIRAETLKSLPASPPSIVVGDASGRLIVVKNFR